MALGQSHKHQNEIVIVKCITFYGKIKLISHPQCKLNVGWKWCDDACGFKNKKN